MVKINRLSLKGDGIGQVVDGTDTHPVYASFTCPGDIIESGIETGSLDEYRIIEASVDRTTPVCRHFGECGGCTYQHISYEAQVRHKRSQLQNMFQEFFDSEQIVLIPSNEPYRYRNRLTLQTDGSVIGFYSHNSNKIFPLSECPVANSHIEEEALKLISEGIPPGYCGITLYEDADGLHRHYLQQKADSAAFMQVNPHINARIIEHMRSIVHKKGPALKILDLYCGNGNLSFPLFDIVAQVTGIDISIQSIAAAKAKAEHLGFEHYRFIDIPVEKARSAIQGYSQETDLMILDPPRRGLHKEASFLAGLDIQSIIYVSCNPVSLKKDLQYFISSGYEIRSLTGYDMFPQTPHMETLCELELIR